MDVDFETEPPGRPVELGEGGLVEMGIELGSSGHGAVAFLLDDSACSSRVDTRDGEWQTPTDPIADHFGRRPFQSGIHCVARGDELTMLRFTKRADYGLMAIHYIAVHQDLGSV